MTRYARHAPTYADLNAALSPTLLDSHSGIGRYRCPVVPHEVELANHWISGDQGGLTATGVRVAGRPVHSPMLEQVLRSRHPALNSWNVRLRELQDLGADRTETVQFLDLVADTARRSDELPERPLRPGELRWPGGEFSMSTLNSHLHGYVADLYELLLPLMEAQWPDATNLRDPLGMLEEMSGGFTHRGKRGVRIVMAEPDPGQPALHAAVLANNVAWFAFQRQTGSIFPQEAYDCARRAILMSGPAQVQTPDRAAAVDRVLLGMLGRHLR